MSIFVRLAAVAAALAVASPAVAQQRQGPRVGLGISVVPIQAGLDILPPVEIYVPIAVTPNFRIEPSLGIFTFDGDVQEQSNVTLGIGAFLVNGLASNVDMYAGGRLKLNFASEDDGVDDDGGRWRVLPRAQVLDGARGPARPVPARRRVG
jgi:hypothetical protein